MRDFDNLREQHRKLIEELAAGLSHDHFRQVQEKFQETVAIFDFQRSKARELLVASFAPDPASLTEALAPATDFLSGLIPRDLVESLVHLPSPVNATLRIAELEQRVADLEAANAPPEPPAARPDSDDEHTGTGQYL
jgi:hypothetical protein